jgi:antitoxin component of RelBE/YafQ-DinJ toxin-antitoxin module
METITLKIDTRNDKGKHLLMLIKEMAETEKEYITIEHTPNAETIKALEDSKAGRVVKTKNKEDFFAKLNS